MWLRLERGPKEIAAVVDARKGTKVSGRVAVVWRRKHSAAKPLMLLCIAILAHFVAAQNRRNVVVLAPRARNVWSKAKTNATLGRSTTSHRLGIAPQELHHEALLAGLLLGKAVDGIDFVQRDIVTAKQTAMDDKEALATSRGVNNRRGLCERLACICRQLL